MLPKIYLVFFLKVFVVSAFTADIIISGKKQWMMANWYIGHYLSNVCVCGLLIIRRIKNYWKQLNIDIQVGIDLQESLKVFVFVRCRETPEVSTDDWFEVRRNRYDLTKKRLKCLTVTQIDKMVLFALEGNDCKGVTMPTNIFVV